MTTKYGEKMVVLGVMSGTSLDGLDLAICSFNKTGENFDFEILAAKTIEYESSLRQNLAKAGDLSALEYFKLNASYGKFIGEEINKFTKTTGKTADAISSHGHTVFHQPEFGFSTQIGSGAAIAAVTGIRTVFDLRSLDVALGGQGAPLVPIGDELLFGKFAACLNIGGIANISYKKEGKRIAYDICVANMMLNYLSEKLGKPYDEGGNIARSGKPDDKLLTQLKSLAYYSEKGAKSIGREWFETTMLPLIAGQNNFPDLLATFTEHIGLIIGKELTQNNLTNALVTGGGAFNSYLLECIRKHTSCQIVVPEDQTVQFKEALIFAFLGYLRLTNKINSLASVTGASCDSVGGSVFEGN